KSIVLPVREEIQLVVSSFIEIFKVKFILPDSSNEENPNDKEDNVNKNMKDDIDDGDDGQNTNLVKMAHVHKQSSLPPSSHHSIIKTRSKSKLIEKPNVVNLKRLICAPDLLTLGLFPNAKEITESYAVWAALRRFIFSRFEKSSSKSIDSIP
ncbi:unnamed protein product, partial [Rotaria magnacalcarata]